MYKGIIASGTTISTNVNIPFTTIRNTNWKTSYDTGDDTIKIKEKGYYNVAVSLPITNASATPLTLQLYANGIPISDAICVNDITTTTGQKTLIIVDCIKVESIVGTGIAKLSVRLTGGTARMNADGKIIVQER